MLYGRVTTGSCNDMNEARQHGTTLDKGKKPHIRSNANDLKRAGDGQRSTSSDKLRLLVEACNHVPTTKMRVNGHFRHHTFLFSFVGG